MNCLETDELRQGIKSFSNWPTIPQIYIKGEFIGGSDILRELFQSGELFATLTEKGISLRRRPEPRLNPEAPRQTGPQGLIAPGKSGIAPPRRAACGRALAWRPGVMPRV